MDKIRNFFVRMMTAFSNLPSNVKHVIFFVTGLFTGLCFQ